MHASEKNFKELFNSSDVPQWIYDTNSMGLLSVNEAAIKQYGYSAKEFLNMTIQEIAPDEEDQKLILYNEFMKTTSEPFSVVSFHRKKNNENVLVETTYVNIKYNEQSCILVSSTDINEKIKQEKKISLMKVSRQQEITLATINEQEEERDQVSKELHDNINQLLVSVKIYLGLIRSNGKIRTDFIDDAELILQKAINETRSLADSLVPSTLKLMSFENSLMSLLETYLATKTFRIKLSFGKEMNNLDKEIKISLFRILQEQLNNILNHAEAKNVVISLSATDQIYLTINDDGKGFNTKIKHAGLGISNIKNRIELYNGTVEFISEPQHGCTLLISIPNGKNNKNNAYANVLIVEDDPDDQKTISRAFAEVGPHYNIGFLNDGKMLIDRLQSYADNELPSLIVLDYNMPLLNGLETLRVLELDQRFNKIPKIIYSSSSQNYIKNLCYSANAKAYVTKGLTMDEIKENIQEMLSFARSNNIQNISF